ncbi:MAG: hypothetical protein ACOZNI_30990, partial [Myxococcota bacterium]
MRWHDDQRTLDLSVHDLLDAEAPSVDRALAMSDRARMAAGVALHQEVQAAQAYRAEVALKHRVVVRGWTCTVHARVDGLGEEDGRTVVEEIKSSALGADALDAV